MYIFSTSSLDGSVKIWDKAIVFLLLFLFYFSVIEVQLKWLFLHFYFVLFYLLYCSIVSIGTNICWFPNLIIISYVITNSNFILNPSAGLVMFFINWSYFSSSIFLIVSKSLERTCRPVFRYSISSFVQSPSFFSAVCSFG